MSTIVPPGHGIEVIRVHRHYHHVTCVCGWYHDEAGPLSSAYKAGIDHLRYYEKGKAA